MSASAGTGVYVLSLTSIVICFLFNSLVHNNSAEAVFAGCTSVITLTISVWFLLQMKPPKDPLFYVYAVFAFFSIVSLIIGLEQDNIIDGIVTFYLRQADPHIQTAHGHMISYWDGCVHYLMYLLMITAITWEDSYRAVGLYWVGSFLMYAIVYILGNAVGRFGTHVGPFLLLHLLCVTVAVWACFRFVSQPSTRELTSSRMTHRTSLLQRPLDLFFVIYLIPAFAFCVLRGLIALGCSDKWCQDYTEQYEPYLKDPSAYPKVQMLANMLYSGPYYILTLYGLLVPGCEWMPDLALVHSGALAQAQFAHIGASLHTRTPICYRVPADSQTVFLLVNILYALVPQLLCYRCFTRPAFFLSRSTADRKSE